MGAKCVESTVELMSELDAAGHKLVVAEFYARWCVREIIYLERTRKTVPNTSKS